MKSFLVILTILALFVGILVGAGFLQQVYDRSQCAAEGRIREMPAELMGTKGCYIKTPSGWVSIRDLR